MLHLLMAGQRAGAGAKEAQVRCMVRGTETVLGDAAALDELFLSDAFETRCRLACPCVSQQLHRGSWSGPEGNTVGFAGML